MAAATTGMKLRGCHSNSNSSTASSSEASGALKGAAIPAAAPATSSVLRSSADMCSVWASSEPTAPPVMMIGPSAPKGPLLPMLIAAEMGFSMATLGSTRLPAAENRLDGLGHAVTADLLRSEPRHQADDEIARDRRQQDEQSLVAPGVGATSRVLEALVEDEVGDRVDQSQQGQGGDGRWLRSASVQAVMVSTRRLSEKSPRCSTRSRTGALNASGKARRLPAR